MNKKIIIPLLVLLIAGIFLLMKFSIKEPVQKDNPAANAAVTITPTIKLPSNVLKEYTDPSGFIFSYPEDIEVVNQETDNSTYSSLILTSPVATGSISLKVSDTKYKSIEAWKKDSQEQIAGLDIQEAKLGELTGISFVDNNVLTQLVFDQGIEFKINVNFEDENKYWENVYNTVISNFSFTSNTNNTSNSSADISTESDVIFEGEEVIE